MIGTDKYDRNGQIRSKIGTDKLEVRSDWTSRSERTSMIRTDKYDRNGQV